MPGKTPTRVLVIRDDKVGDLLLTLPAVRAIRHAYPCAELTLLLSPYNVPVVRDWPVADRVELYDRAWPVRQKVAVARTLRQHRYDLCIVLRPDLEAFVVARYTGAPVRAGLVHARVILDRILAPLLLTHPCVSYVERAAAGGEPVDHEVTATRRVLERLGIAWAGDALELPQSTEALAWADAVAAPAGPVAPVVVGVHLSPKWFDGGWTSDQLGRLLRVLADARPGHVVIATHGPADAVTVTRVLETGAFAPAPGAAVSADVLVSENGRIRVIAVDFPRLAALTARCHVVVTRDTGSLHVSSAAGRPVVAIYAPERFEVNRQQFAPWRVPSVILRDGPFDRLAPAIVAAVCSLTAPARPAMNLRGPGLESSGVGPEPVRS